MYVSTAFLSPDLPLPILLQVNKLELCLTDQIYGESGLHESSHIPGACLPLGIDKIKVLGSPVGAWY